jgi:hypothetical protein
VIAVFESSSDERTAVGLVRGVHGRPAAWTTPDEASAAAARYMAKTKLVVVSPT